MTNEQRIKKLEEQLELLYEKLYELEDAHIIETDAGRKFQYKQNIEKTKKDIDIKEKEIEELKEEKQKKSLKKPIIKLKKKKYKKYLKNPLIITIIIIFFIAIPLFHSLIPKPEPDPSNVEITSAVDDIFRVLILPLDPLSKCQYQETDMEAAIKRSLLELKDENINLKVIIDKDRCTPDDFEDGRKIGEEYNADLVIWGELVDKCYPDTTKGRVCYALLKEIDFDIGDKSSGDTGKLQPTSIEQIREGHLQKDIEFIILWVFGWEAYKRADYQQAISCFEKIEVESTEENVMILTMLGMCYLSLGKGDEGITNFTEAIKLNPKDAIAYYNRGTVYSHLEKHNEAIADYTEAIELNSKDADVYYNRGNAYLYLKKYDEAITDYTEAIKLNPKDAKTYNNRGGVYKNLERYDEAIKDFNQAIKLNPKDKDAEAYYYNRGNVYKNLEKYDKAIADYTKAIKLNPNDAMTYYNRGNAYFYLGKYDEAIADYNQVIKLKPKYAEAYSNRGNVYKKLKKYDEAIADYEKFIELAKSNPKLKSHIPRVQEWIEELRNME